MILGNSRSRSGVGQLRSVEAPWSCSPHCAHHPAHTSCKAQATVLDMCVAGVLFIAVSMYAHSRSPKILVLKSIVVAARGLQQETELQQVLERCG